MRPEHDAGRRLRARGENDATRAQESGQRRPFLAVLPRECAGQPNTAIYRAGLTPLSRQITAHWQVKDMLSPQASGPARGVSVPSAFPSVNRSVGRLCTGAQGA